MASNMDWSPDYCLSCDRQTEGGAYCSQACRLADLEKAKSPSQLSSSASSTASSSGNMDANATSAMGQARFEPCTENGVAVVCESTASFIYELE